MRDRVEGFLFIFILFLVLVVLVGLIGCMRGGNPDAVEGGALTIFHAGSLTVPLDALIEAFQSQYPEVRFETESSGSRTAARKVSELGREADLVMSADYTVIEDLLVPEFADWTILFARNEMVIAYTERSKYADEIDATNWYEVLLREGVVCGHSDPDADPCGYRTLMLWQLAEEFYARPGLSEQLRDHCPPENSRPKAVELIALLQSGDIDYAFGYRSVAVQHGLRYIELPPELNLCCVEQADFYRRAQVELRGREPGDTTTVVGSPIVYGLTIPKSAAHPELAIEFVRFVLGEEGRQILASLGQPPVFPPRAEHHENLPEGLRDLIPEE